MTIDANGHASSSGSAGASIAPAELDSLLRDQAPRIYAIARLYTGGRSDAEDVMQDAFEALLTTAASIERPLHWLITVIKRKALKSNARQMEMCLAEFPEGWAVDEASPENQILRTASVRELLAAIEEVSPKASEYFEYLADGYTYSEIAERCDITAEAVRKCVDRLRRHLREQMLSREPDLDTIGRVDNPFQQTASEDHILVDSVAALPTRQQEVLGLALDGLRPRAIATTLGITSNTARVNLHHAKKKIAENVGCPIDEVMIRLHQLGERLIRLAS